MIGRASCLLGSPPIALPLPPTEGRLIPARSRLRFYVNGLSAHVGRRDWLDWVRRSANTDRGPIWLPRRVRWHTATPSTRVLPAHTVYETRCTRPCILLACSCYLECGKTHLTIYQAGRTRAFHSMPSPFLSASVGRPRIQTCRRYKFFVSK